MPIRPSFVTLLSLITLAGVQAGCKRKGALESAALVTNGLETSAYPGVLSLTKQEDDGNDTCSASRISPGVFLTAAHCIGKNLQYERSEGRFTPVRRLMAHPRHCLEAVCGALAARDSRYDLAVFLEPEDAQQGFSPLAREAPASPADFLIVGYGHVYQRAIAETEFATLFRSFGIGVKRCGVPDFRGKTKDPRIGEMWVVDGLRAISKKMVGRRSSCASGDSGGPLFLDGKQVGVLSFMEIGYDPGGRAPQPCFYVNLLDAVNKRFLTTAALLGFALDAPVPRAASAAFEGAVGAAAQRNTWQGLEAGLVYALSSPLDLGGTPQTPARILAYAVNDEAPKEALEENLDAFIARLRAPDAETAFLRIASVSGTEERRIRLDVELRKRLRGDATQEDAEEYLSARCDEQRVAPRLLNMTDSVGIALVEGAAYPLPNGKTGRGWGVWAQTDPAAREPGKLRIGDIITSFNGRAVEGKGELRAFFEEIVASPSKIAKLGVAYRIPVDENFRLRRLPDFRTFAGVGDLAATQPGERAPMEEANRYPVELRVRFPLPGIQ